MKKPPRLKSVKTLTSRPRPERGQPERRCIVSGETAGKDGLIRFVVGPERRIVADIGGRLPGHGIWVGARRDLLQQAVRRKLFARAAREAVDVDPGLCDQVETLLTRRCMEVLGLCRRAGLAVAGHDKVLEWLEQGKAHVLLQAADGSEQGRHKLAVKARGLPHIDILTREELGLALGRENVVHAALSSGGLTSSFLVEAQRLAGFRSPVLPLGASVAELA